MRGGKERGRRREREGRGVCVIGVRGIDAPEPPCPLSTAFN